MRISLIISVILKIAGALLLILALLSGIASILSLAERMRYGPGLLFADVEFFGLLAVISGGLGILMVILAKMLAKR